MRVLAFLTSAFPLWVLVASALALYHPPLFAWFSGPFITVGLGIIMLSMGMTLGFDDFRRIARHRRLVVPGVALQYTVMPTLGWAIGYVYGLPTEFAVGLVLVSSCPGGTASNVISFLAKTDVALSVTLTALSTLLAVVMTPTLTELLAGSRVAVPAAGLLLSTVQVVILPVVLGVSLNRYLPTLTRAVLPVAPLIAVLTIVLIVASIIGAGKQQILEAGPRLLLAVLTLHVGGFFFGYVAGRVILRHEISARTIAIEVGMQNSGLGVVLARQNFPSPLVAIPCAISAVFHSLIGSLVAAAWRRSATQAVGAIATPAIAGHSRSPSSTSTSET